MIGPLQSCSNLRIKMTHETRIQRDSNLYEALLNEVLGRFSQALLLLNTEAEILFCSESIQLITGHVPPELIGRTVFEFFHADDLSATRQQYGYLAEVKENASASLIQVRKKDGNMVWVDVVVKNLVHISGINAVFVMVKKNGGVGTEERKLVQAVTDAREEEREFLATELHDNVNQIITATKLLVDSSRLNPDNEKLLLLSSSNLQLVAEEIRRLSYSMVSYDLREFGLSYALKAFISTITSASPVRFDTVMEEEALLALTSEQQLHLYRIIQEGTNNILRHAGASLANISLQRQDNLVYLTIKDNGKGFPLQRLKPGMGLSSIANRVKLLQGHFHVRAPKGVGTIIEIHFPV